MDEMVVKYKDLNFICNRLDGLLDTSYAEVQEAIYKEKKVEFKVIDNHRFNVEQKQKVLSEARNMFDAKHQNIVRLYGIVLDDTTRKYGIVTEKMELGSLEILQTKVKIPDGVKVKMMWDISVAMKYLHHQKLIHADVKLANIMISGRLQAKLGGFGISMFHNITSEISNGRRMKGALTHMAPELVKKDSPMEDYSVESDVWSFGVTLYELLLEKTPFTGRADKEVDIICMISLNKVQPTVQQDCDGREPRILGTLAVSCVDFDKKKRPKFTDITGKLCKEFQKKHEINYAQDCNNVRWELQRKGVAVDQSMLQGASGGEFTTDVTIDHQYEMKVPVGLVLIINNHNFLIGKDRRGSQVDLENADKTLSDLGFETHLHENLTRDELLACFQHYGSLDLGQYSSLIVVVMSHGRRSHVYGVDGKDVPIIDLTSQFKASECPSLKQKPKCFIIVACQSDCPGNDDSRSPEQVEREEEEDGEEEEEGKGEENDGINKSIRQTDLIPLDERDYIVCYSTMPGTKSKRSKKGTRYMQCLMTNIAKYAHSHCLSEVMRNTIKHVLKQTPLVFLSLQKAFILKANVSGEQKHDPIPKFTRTIVP